MWEKSMERKKVKIFATVSKSSPQLPQTKWEKKQQFLTVSVWLCSCCLGDVLAVCDSGLREHLPKASFTESKRLYSHLLAHLVSFLEGLMAVQTAWSNQKTPLIYLSAIKILWKISKIPKRKAHFHFDTGSVILFPLPEMTLHMRLSSLRFV